MTTPPRKPATSDIVARAKASADARPKRMPQEDKDREIARCAEDIFYFIDKYVLIYDNIQTQQWLPFSLWPEQKRALAILLAEKYVIVMKARQLGITWLYLAYALWKMRFRPIAEILMFSQRKADAEELLNRLQGMYSHLPDWMQLPVLKSNTEEFQIENESRASQSAAAAGGRSRALTDVLIDEGDFVENMARLVTAAKATIDMGKNKMVVISTVNEDAPNSYYQRMFNAAVKGSNSWSPVFIAWYSHPERYKVMLRLTDVSETSLTFETLTGTPERLNMGYSKFPVRLYNTTRNTFRTVAHKQMLDMDGTSYGYSTEGSAAEDRIETVESFDHWHEGDVVIDALWNDEQERESLENSGTLDAKYKEYPATIAEALALRSFNVRFYPPWLQACYAMRKPLPIRVSEDGVDLTKIPGLRIFSYPETGQNYGIGADPAQGLSDGDDAVACVINALTKEQVAVISGKIEPSKFGEHIAALSIYYNNAPVLFELNNHGHALRAKLKELAVNLRPGMTKRGPSREPGWLTTEWSKTEMYDTAVKVIQEEIEEAKQSNAAVVPIIYDANTYGQLSHIDATNLEAPEREHDDHAVAWALAQVCVYRGVPSMSKVKHNLYGRSPVANPLPNITGKPPALPHRVASPQTEAESINARSFAWRSGKRGK